jgi:group I intron endonuclease
MNVDTGVYSIRNAVNGKIYVGSAQSFNRRWNTHRRQLRNGIHPNRKLQAAWNKYGPDAFLFEKMALCSVLELLAIEQRYIDRMRPEYNLTPTAGSQLGFKPSPESIARGIAAKKGKYLGENSPHWGLKRSPTTKALQSSIRIGRFRGKDHARAVSIVCVETGMEFDSLIAAQRWLKESGKPKASSAAICNACRSTTKTAYGYTWRRSGDADKESVVTKGRRGEHSPFSKPLICIELGRQFAGFSDAARWLHQNGFPKASNSALVSVCKGKQKTAYGFRWKYAD